ncbi:MAG: hypothetical protein QNK04_21960 [Myxococcota bacterium]|nr:hypothetical protein [Myxococcota bacterium]
MVEIAPRHGYRLARSSVYPRDALPTTLLIVVAALLVAGVAAAEPHPEKDWEIRITPYLWFTNAVGSVRADGFEIDIDAGFGDIFENLNLALFAEVDVRWRRFVAYVDIIYANLGDKTRLGPVPLEWELEKLIVDAKFGYRVLSRHVGPGPAEAGSARGRLDLDLLAGVRYWNVTTDIFVGSLPIVGPLRFDAKQEWAEPLVGFQLGWRPCERWWFGARADAGGFHAGKAEVTWRAALVGRFSLSRRWDLLAGYRALGIAEDDGSGADRASLDFVMHGPVLGVSFHF